MNDAGVSNVSRESDEAVPRARKIVLFGAPSVYLGAMKCLIENRLAESGVTEIAGDEELLRCEADIVLIDVDLDHISDRRLTELAALIKGIAPRPVLLICGGVQPALLQRLLRDGVAGVVLKSSGAGTLIEAIESVGAGKVWLQRDLLTETFGESSHVRRVCSQAPKVAQLTQREREIIAVACGGLTNRQVGNKLHISEATVRHHLSSIFAKLGVANRGELIIFAYRHGLVDDADRQQLC